MTTHFNLFAACAATICSAAYGLVQNTAASDPPQSIAQSQQDVSQKFAAADGVKVTQITSTAGGNVLSYYDIPFYSPAIDRLIYNSIELDEPLKAVVGKPGKKGLETWKVISANPDGTDARVLAARKPPSMSADRADLSADGALVSYARKNLPPETGWDLYGIKLSDAGVARERRITQQQFPLTQKIKTSPATPEGATDRYVLAFSVDEKLFVAVWDDGASGAPAKPREIVLTDPESKASFHRVRLNPRFSNLIMYRRNPLGTKETDGASPNLWVVDWTVPVPASVRWHDHAKGPHMTWTPDGRHIAVDRLWTEFEVATADGKVIAGLNPSSVRSREIGPFGRGDPKFPPIFYGSYSRDGAWLVVATRPDSDEGGKLWLMDRTTGNVSYLARAHSFGPVTTGQPRLGFFKNDRAIAFSTDASWGDTTSAPPQIYTVTGFRMP